MVKTLRGEAGLQVSLLQRGKGFLSWSGTWSWQAAGLERFLSVGGRRGRWWGDAVYMHVKEMETMLLLRFLVWVTSEHSRQEWRDGVTGCWQSAIVKDSKLARPPVRVPGHGNRTR